MRLPQNPLTVIVLLFSLAVLVTNVFLLQKNRELRSRVQTLTRALEPQVGMFPPPSNWI